jgi:hypothetical protein
MHTHTPINTVFALSLDHESDETGSLLENSTLSDCTNVSTVFPAGCTYILVGDNIDKTVSARHATMDHQSQSLHYFHCYAAMDRISFSQLDNSRPISNVRNLPLSAFIPSMEDCDMLLKNYTVLLGREMVKMLPFFEVFADCVPQHITHKFSHEMKCKSFIVSLQCEIVWCMHAFMCIYATYTCMVYLFTACI